jgi:hypothetical protein
MAQLIENATKARIDPANLKSFQRISEEDMRYLREVDRVRRESLAAGEDEMRETIPLRQRLRAASITARKIMRRMLNKIIYERVPADKSYSERI